MLIDGYRAPEPHDFFTAPTPRVPCWDDPYSAAGTPQAPPVGHAVCCFPRCLVELLRVSVILLDGETVERIIILMVPWDDNQIHPCFLKETVEGQHTHMMLMRGPATTPNRCVPHVVTPRRLRRMIPDQVRDHHPHSSVVPAPNTPPRPEIPDMDNDFNTLTVGVLECFQCVCFVAVPVARNHDSLGV